MLRVLHDFVDSDIFIRIRLFHVPLMLLYQVVPLHSSLMRNLSIYLNFCVYYLVVTPVVKRKVVDWYITQLTVWTRNYNPEIVRFSMFSGNNISGSMDIGGTKTQNIEKTSRKSTN